MEVSVNVLQNVNLEIVNRTEVNQGPVAKVSACISLWKKYMLKCVVYVVFWDHATVLDWFVRPTTPIARLSTCIIMLDLFRIDL